MIEVVSSGGGGNTPAKIIFSGEVFPEATLGIYLMGDKYGQVLIDEEFKTEADGSFYKEIISPVEEKRFYGLLIKDRDGNPAKSKFFTYNLKFNTIVHQENLIFAPIINISKTVLTRGELLLISGYAASGNKVEALIDGQVIESTQAEGSGLYKILINTERLVLGSHKIQTRQIDSGSNKASDVSETKTFRTSSFSFTNIDFNEDGNINIQDWSIFLHNWSSEDENSRKKNDLNGDGKLDVSDFSVFLMSFQLGNR